jgi:uncharacterized protein
VHSSRSRDHAAAYASDVTSVFLGVMALLLAGLAYGIFEAGWLRRRVIEVAIEDLPPQLVGLRIGHLSDFHLGFPSLGGRASKRAVAWVAGREPDVVAVTGDLVSRPRGVATAVALLGSLSRPIVVLGNHDVGSARDPFSRTASLQALDEVACVLRDAAMVVEHGGCRIQIVGVDPRTYRARAARPWELADPTADLRILLCHYPDVVRRLPQAAFHLVLAGHVHAGQITLPHYRGTVTFAHPRARYVAGVYETPPGVLHVSPGLGTTFLPFRFFARPEVTELVLRRPAPAMPQSR